MNSIFAQALGAEFDKLHPRIQQRFGFGSEHRLASIGRGVMTHVWHGPFFIVPFLHLGASRRIMFPESGHDIPFTIQNYAYRDTLGRETVSIVRTFNTTPIRRFDAYMIYAPQRGKIVDYLGTHQHLAVDIDLSADDEGGLRLRSGAQRFYEGVFGFHFPMCASAIADVREWFDERTSKFRIEVNAHNPVLGPVFGYAGWFDVEWLPMGTNPVPHEILPRRVERRV